MAKKAKKSTKKRAKAAAKPAKKTAKPAKATAKKTAKPAKAAAKKTAKPAKAAAKKTAKPAKAAARKTAKPAKAAARPPKAPPQPGVTDLAGKAMIIHILGDAEAYFFDFTRLSPARRDELIAHHLAAFDQRKKTEGEADWADQFVPIALLGESMPPPVRGRFDLS